jgi:hypothetical protein
MIVKEYYQNINCNTPKNYFEKWYADVWRRRIAKRNAAPGVVEAFMAEELGKYNATLGHKDNGYRFVVTFNNDADYTAFVLRWA